MFLEGGRRKRGPSREGKRASGREKQSGKKLQRRGGGKEKMVMSLGKKEGPMAKWTIIGGGKKKRVITFEGKEGRRAARKGGRVFEEKRTQTLRSKEKLNPPKKRKETFFGGGGKKKGNDVFNRKKRTPGALGGGGEGFAMVALGRGGVGTITAFGRGGEVCQGKKETTMMMGRSRKREGTGPC